MPQPTVFDQNASHHKKRVPTDPHDWKNVTSRTWSPIRPSRCLDDCDDGDDDYFGCIRFEICSCLVVFDILILIPGKSGQLRRFSRIQRSHFLLRFKSKSSIHNEIQNRDVTFEESQIHHQQLQLPPRCSILQQQLQLQTPLEKERFKAKIRTQSVPHWMLFWKSKEDSHLRGSGQFQVVYHRSFMQEHAVLRPEYIIVWRELKRVSLFVLSSQTE